MGIPVREELGDMLGMDAVAAFQRIEMHDVDARIDRKLRALNHEFRGKEKPTNVLSFPGLGGYAGDIALAYGVTRKEAKAAGKSLAAHATHLVVHGVLHLAGHDHEKPKEARAMESLEVKILGRLGIDDPYAVPAP